MPPRAAFIRRRRTIADPAVSAGRIIECMQLLRPPEGVLADVLMSLRVLSVGDVDALAGYAGRDGAWLPSLKRRCAAGALPLDGRGWLAAWAGDGSDHGPALVLTTTRSPWFVGYVGFTSRGAGTVGLSCGVAPSWRGRDLATRAVGLAADWLIRERDAQMVEFRAGRDSPACQRVAVKAGFSLAGTVSRAIEATGDLFEDLRYIITAGGRRVHPRSAL